MRTAPAQELGVHARAMAATTGIGTRGGCCAALLAHTTEQHAATGADMPMRLVRLVVAATAAVVPSAAAAQLGLPHQENQT